MMTLDALIETERRAVPRESADAPLILLVEGEDEVHDVRAAPDAGATGAALAETLLAAA